MKKFRSLRSCLILSLSLVIAFDVYGIYLLSKHGVFKRLIKVDNINDPSIGDTKPIGPPDEQQALLTELEKAGLDSLKGEKQVVAVLKWTMNQVDKIEHVGKKTPYAIVVSAKNENKGALCGGMASILHETLALLKVKARRISLSRNTFNIYDSHATVEVFLNGKWQIYDPTFNISYKSLINSSQLMSAQEMKDALVKGNFNKIKPIFYGNTAYPARLETYYMHYLPLYNNVFISGRVPRSFWKKLPPLRYFYGPVFLYQDDSSGRGGTYHIGLQQSMYFVFVVLLPVAIGIIALSLILCIGKQLTDVISGVPCSDVKRDKL